MQYKPLKCIHMRLIRCYCPVRPENKQNQQKYEKDVWSTKEAKTVGAFVCKALLLRSHTHHLFALAGLADNLRGMFLVTLNLPIDTKCQVEDAASFDLFEARRFRQ